MGKVTLKPMEGAPNPTAGTTAPAGTQIRTFAPLDFMRRTLPKLGNDELRNLHADIAAVLHQRRHSVG